MKKTIKDAVPLLKQTYQGWNEHKAPRLGAALAYYTVFSIGPLLFIVLQIVGLIYQGNGARQKLIGQLSGLIGPVAAKAVESMMGSANHPSHGILGTIIGFVTLLAGAAGIFGQLQDSLNTIWEVAPKPGRSFLANLKDRFASFAMVAGTGFLLMVSLVLSAAVAMVSKFMQSVLPVPGFVLGIGDFALSFAIVTLLFAMIFKVLPDVEITWSDVWVGAALTSVLFAIGKFALGFYLGRSGVTSTYGAAGSLVLLLLWVYYAAQIMFFGAEFTRAYANHYGSHVRPSADAVAITHTDKAKQGMPAQEDMKIAAMADGKAKSDDAPPANTNGASGGIAIPNPLDLIKSIGKKKEESHRGVEQTLATYRPVTGNLAIATTQDQDATKAMPRIVLRDRTPETLEFPETESDRRQRHGKAVLAGVVLGLATSLRRPRR